MAIPALMMAMLFPVIGAAAVFLLLRGHDLPGGGFVAGVTMAVAFILQYMARGTVWVEARLRVLPVRWMGIGLLLAVGVGAAAWLFDRPFLTSSFSYVEIPLIGAVPLASALLFDLGVFALVVGATVLMLIAIAHQSVRSHRAPSGRAPARLRHLQRPRCDDGDHPCSRHRRARRFGRLADPSAAHVPGDHRPVAAFLCGQSFHHRHGAASGPAPLRSWRRARQAILRTLPIRCRKRWS